MRSVLLAAAVAMLLAPQSGAETPAAPWSLQRSDVVFMYQADRGTYEEYGATVLAWGGQPTPESLEAARGVSFFGSVGMVTVLNRRVSKPVSQTGTRLPDYQIYNFHDLLGILRSDFGLDG